MDADVVNPRLVILGCGYCATYFARTRAHDFGAIAGATRGAARFPELRSAGVAPFRLEADHFDPGLSGAIAGADYLLVSAPPGPDDLAPRALESAIANSPARALVYLSSVGVYGDRGGAWVDETSAARPANGRGRARIAAEDGWRALAEAGGRNFAAPRLAGVYGPGRNALVQLRRGTARRIVKRGHVFNRIHVEDVARAIAAAFAGALSGAVNVANDEPCPAAEVIAFAAALAGIRPPPEIACEDADLTPTARSFYDECKRVTNVKLKRAIGALAFPTYREGLGALWREGEGR